VADRTRLEQRGEPAACGEPLAVPRDLNPRPARPRGDDDAALRPAELCLGDLTIEGLSLAGDQTWFRVRPPGLAFDVGRGASQLAGARDIFLSHGHLDHALGLPYVLSQRSLHQHAATRVFCPAPIAKPLTMLIEAAAQLERVHYACEIVPLAVGDRVPVARDLTIEAFATDHVVPSLGYHLHRRKQRLAAAFAGLAGNELAALRQRGVQIAETVEEQWLTYCGDTGPAVFDLSPALFDSRILLLECTFLDADLPGMSRQATAATDLPGGGARDKGELYKHLYFSDIERVAGRFRNQHIVLHHLSRRYRMADLRAALAARLPELAPRVHLMTEGTAP
jgi:ribonuclease Z